MPRPYKRKSTGSLPKTTNVAKYKRLSELEISPLIESLPIKKVPTKGRKRASPPQSIKTRSSPFNSFSSASFSPVVKRQPVYSNALKENKTSNFDRSSTMISKLTGQTYGFNKEGSVTAKMVEIIEAKINDKGKNLDKKANVPPTKRVEKQNSALKNLFAENGDSSIEYPTRKSVEKSKYPTDNLFDNEKDVSAEYPTRKSTEKNKVPTKTAYNAVNDLSVSIEFPSASKSDKSYTNKAGSIQTKPEFKKPIPTTRKSEVMFDALGSIDESIEMPGGQAKNVAAKNTIKSRQIKSSEKKFREPEMVRKIDKAPLPPPKIKEPAHEKVLKTPVKAASEVTSSQLVGKFRTEMKSLLSNFYKSFMDKIEAKKLTLQERTKQLIQTTDAAKVDLRKIELEKQTLWRNLENDLLPMLNDMNSELSLIAKSETQVQDALKNHFESIRANRENVKNRVGGILNCMSSYRNKIQQCTTSDSDKKAEEESSNIVELNHGDNKSDEGVDSAQESLLGLFDGL